MVTFIVIIVAYFKHRLGMTAAAFLLVIALAKPQLVVLIIPGILISIFRQRGAKTAILFCFLFLSAFLLLSVPSFIAEPGWVTDYIDSLRQNPTWLQTSLFSLLPLQFGAVGSVTWLLLAISIFIVNIFLWWNYSPERAVLWSLALTPLITPYIWSWDFVLMLPLFVAIIIEAKRRKTLFLLVGGYIIVWIGIVSLSMSGNVSNELFWWIPLYILALVLTAMWLEHRLRLWPDPRSILNRNATTVIKLGLSNKQNHGGRNGECNTDQDSLGVISGRTESGVYSRASKCASGNSVSMDKGYPATGYTGFHSTLSEREERTEAAKDTCLH